MECGAGVGSLENTRQTGGSLVVLAPRGFGGEGLGSSSEVSLAYGAEALDALC